MGTGKAKISPNGSPRAPEAEDRGAEARGKEESGHEPESPGGPSGKQGQGKLSPEAQELKEPFKFE